MSAKIVADEIRGWAAKSGLLHLTVAEPNYDPSEIRQLVGEGFLKAASHVLRRRHISFIGYSESRNNVTVYTPGRITKAEMDTLPQAASNGVTIRYRRGGGATSVPIPPPPINVPSFVSVNGRYTCGSSIYLGTEKGAGTFGSLIKDSHGLLCGLTNNHISAGCNYAQLGLPISAPGIKDILPGQQDPFTIGHHYGTAPFVDGISDNVDSSKNVDAAIFRISDPNKVTSSQRGLFDTPGHVIPLDDTMHVQKAGRTSHLTSGDVTDVISGAQQVEYAVDAIKGKKIVEFDDLFVISGSSAPFAYGGDSGSLITTKIDGGERYAVGLVVAVDDFGLTYAVSLDKVLSAFGATIVSGHNI